MKRVWRPFNGSWTHTVHEPEPPLGKMRHASKIGSMEYGVTCEPSSQLGSELQRSRLHSLEGSVNDQIQERF